MDAPKRIFAWSAYPTSHLVGTWGVTRYPNNAEHYILVSEHDRLMAEKDAEIARLGRKEEMMSDLKARLLAGTQVPLFDLRIEAAGEIESLEAERDRWHADATLMLGFADLAYAAGAAPASSELIAARDRALAAIRNAALEDAAQMLLRKFRSMGLIEDFAAAIRAMKD